MILKIFRPIIAFFIVVIGIIGVFVLFLKKVFCTK